MSAFACVTGSGRAAPPKGCGQYNYFHTKIGERQAHACRSPASGYNESKRAASCIEDREFESIILWN